MNSCPYARPDYNRSCPGCREGRRLLLRLLYEFGTDAGFTTATLNAVYDYCRKPRPPQLRIADGMRPADLLTIRGRNGKFRVRT